MHNNEITVRREGPIYGVSVKIEVECFPSPESKREARQVLQRALEDTLLLLGEPVAL